MKFDSLLSALGLKGDGIQIRVDTLRDDTWSTVVFKPFYGSDTLTITGRSPAQPPVITPDTAAKKLVIEGQAALPLLGLDDKTHLLATFALKNVDSSGEGTLSVTVKYLLPKTWQFKQSFPKLPVVVDLKADSNSQQTSTLDRLKFPELHSGENQNLDACIVLATESIDDENYRVRLQPGLNFVGKWDASGMLGVLENLLPGASKQLTLYGPVVLPSAAKSQALTAGQFAWDIQPVVPGVHLQARLDILPSFGETIQFSEVVFRLYSPITSDWLVQNATYQPAMAYVCEINIPSANNLRTILLAKKQLGEDSLLVAAQFQGANVTNLVSLLTEIANGDFTSAIPSEVSSYLTSSSIGDLELESSAAMLVPRQSSYRVAYTYFTLGMPHLNWVIFKDILEVDSLWTEILILNPFETDGSRTISGTIIGNGELLGFRLQITVELPDLLISAQQIGATTLPLKEMFKKFLPEIPAPADLIIEDLKVVAKPGVYYTLSMSIAGDPPWTIDLGTASKLVIEDIAFSLSKHESITGSIAAVLNFKKSIEAGIDGREGENQGVEFHISALVPITSDAGWQFEGSTGPNQWIQVSDLIKQFGGDVPNGLDIAIGNLDIAFNTQSKDFTFKGEVKYPKDEEVFDVRLTIEIKRQQDGTYSKHFSGITTIKGMDFDVIFDSTSGQTAFIAAYNNPTGQQIKIQDLVSDVSPDIGKEVPSSLAFTIKDAVLAYMSESGAGNSAGNIGTEKSEAETADSIEGENKATTPTGKDTSAKFLFGIDIDGGLNLSDLKLPSLPLVGPIFPPDQTLKLSFKLLAAKGIFSLDDVSKLNGLLAGGPQLPNKEINAALDLATILQIGKESKTLDLQIGVNKPPDEKQITDQSKDTKSDSTAKPDTNTGLVPTDSKKPNANVATSTAPSAANAQSADGMQWIVLQKTFGPVSFERIGLAFKDSNITGALDASLMAGGLTIALNGLSVSSPITKFDPKFDLHGLGIDYKNGGLEIGGAFLKQEMTIKDKDTGQDVKYTAFGGTAVIRTEKLTISAIGSYAKYQDHPSLFIYAILDYPLGGPAFFYVTGLAAGFGYNRGLNVPTIDTLNRFPLIADALQGAAPQPSSAGALPAGGQPPNPQDILAAKLTSLESYIPPSVGEYFLAVGIKFTSFKIVESFALLVVKFGRKLEFDLLGLATLVSPPAEEGKSIPPVAKATLALKATFIPDDGIFSLQAQLTSDSFILSQACHLTGGFAFFSWFKDSPDGNIKAGDFVLTLGGYHPKYDVPAHYPKVPALGINWVVNQPGDPYELSIKGDAYFALTSQALMAGGHLEVLWHMDSLRAWIKAGADFLIYWKPYHYDASMYVDIGASYTFDFFGSHTITVDLGADLHLWGPEFAGTATLHIYIFSLTVEFGDQSAKGPTPIDWNTFKTSFLPADDQICTVAVQGGLIRQMEETTGNVKSTRWIVNPKDLVIVTNSVIPSNQATIVNDLVTQKDAGLEIKTKNSSAKSIGVLNINPMGVSKANLSSTHKISITHESKPAEDTFAYEPILKTAPAALWGEPHLEADGETLKPLDVNAEPRFVEKTLAGFEIRPANVLPPEATHSIDKKNLAYELESIMNAYKFAQKEVAPVSFVQGAAAWKQAGDDIKNAASRKNLEEFIGKLGFPAKMLDLGEDVTQNILIEPNPVHHEVS